MSGARLPRILWNETIPWPYRRYIRVINGTNGTCAGRQTDDPSQNRNFFREFPKWRLIDDAVNVLLMTRSILLEKFYVSKPKFPINKLN